MEVDVLGAAIEAENERREAVWVAVWVALWEVGVLPTDVKFSEETTPRAVDDEEALFKSAIEAGVLTMIVSVVVENPLVTVIVQVATIMLEGAD